MSTVYLQTDGSDRPLKVTCMVDENTGFGNFCVGHSFTGTFLNYDDVAQLGQDLITLSEKMEAFVKSFDNFTTYQIQWYVACCREDVPMAERVRHQISDGFGVAIPNMRREDLIKEATSFNESDESTVRRILASLEMTPDGWPMYEGP